MPDGAPHCAPSGIRLTVRSVEHNGRLRKLYTITERGLRRLDSFLASQEEVMGIYHFVRRQRDDKA